MQFESQWSGDAIAAAFCPTYDREDAFFEDLGGRSWGVDRGGDQADANPIAIVLKDRRDLAAKLAPSCPTPSSEQRPQCAAVDWGISRCLSKPNPRGRRAAAVRSWLIDAAIEGLALSAATLHREFFRWGEHAHRRDLGKDRLDGPDADTAPADFAVWRVWINSTASIVAELWSRMRREREIRRISAAWEAIDDRTLKDIGISRCEIEYARDARLWS
jgi:uncharacterized protein YjiS (DUF1127 family)